MQAKAIQSLPSMRKSVAAKDIALTIALFFLSSLLAAIVASALFPESPLAPALIVQAILVVATLHALLTIRSQRWRDIGLQPLAAQDLLRGLLALVLCIALNGILTAIVYLVDAETFSEHMQGLRGVAAELTGAQSLPVILLALLLIGFYEEVLARGLLLARARTLLGGIPAPVLFSSALFGLGHLYQGPLGAVQTTAIGILFAALTLRWGTLWPVIFAHIALNMISVAEIERLGSLALGH